MTEDSNCQTIEIACQNGDVEAIEALLENGAKANYEKFKNGEYQCSNVSANIGALYLLNNHFKDLNIQALSQMNVAHWQALPYIQKSPLPTQHELLKFRNILIRLFTINEDKVSFELKNATAIFSYYEYRKYFSHFLSSINEISEAQHNSYYQFVLQAIETRCYEPEILELCFYNCHFIFYKNRKDQIERLLNKAIFNGHLHILVTLMTFYPTLLTSIITDALFTLVQQGELEAFKLLLKLEEAPINPQNIEGKTLLISAIEHGQHEMVEILKNQITESEAQK